MKTHLVIECKDESNKFFTAAKVHSQWETYLDTEPKSTGYIV